MVVVTRSSSKHSTTMTPHPDPPVSQADLDAQTTQMNAHFDAIMLLLEDHDKLKADLGTIKEEVSVLRDHANTFSSRLDNQDTLINDLPPRVIDILQNNANLLPDVVHSVVQQELGY
jgi:hypothetical protein